jgi:hypothetical protein
MPLQITSSRARASTLAKLYEQFQMFGLTTDISYEEYCKAVDAPMTRRVLKKLFMGRWPRVMGSLKKQYPDVDTVVNKVSTKKAAEPASKPAPKPAPKAESKPASKPAPKAAPKSKD